MAALRQAAHDRRMRALDAFLEAYEAEHGAITDDEMRDTAQRARSRAIAVRTLCNGNKFDAAVPPN